MTVLLLIAGIIVIVIALALLERSAERDRMKRRDSHEDWK